MLYVGLEHGLMNNVRLANSFFSQAHSLAPDDPFVLHELGRYLRFIYCYLESLSVR